MPEPLVSWLIVTQMVEMIRIGIRGRGKCFPPTSNTPSTPSHPSPPSRPPSHPSRPSSTPSSPSTPEQTYVVTTVSKADSLNLIEINLIRSLLVVNEEI